MTSSANRGGCQRIVTSGALALQEVLMNDNLRTAWWSLKLAFFLGPFLAGSDKFFHLLANWDMYLSPIAQRILGGFSHPFMLLVGVVEMIVGLMVITRWTRLGAYIASIWLLLIAINLLTTGQYFDIALRDIGLCLSAFGLAKLTEVMTVTGIRETPIDETPVQIRRAA
jgi:type IV secretory pathway VirB2 component (pilin)